MVRLVEKQVVMFGEKQVVSLVVVEVRLLEMDVVSLVEEELRVVEKQEQLEKMVVTKMKQEHLELGHSDVDEHLHSNHHALTH